MNVASPRKKGCGVWRPNAATKQERTLKCSGSISATVGDTKASKEVNYTVQQSDGKITVSVDPFSFSHLIDAPGVHSDNSRVELLFCGRKDEHLFR
jgi:hypothetical protein